jgi:SNF2 family DNA or RNA helicase
VPAADGPPGSLRTARNARIDLLPHQLEPAIAILRGLGTRPLLADAVGLGKTIQAGLVVSELLTRGSIERVLVLTPPGLREQWLQELEERFAIRAAGVDGHILRRFAFTLPVGVNPWRALSFVVASIDYVKRPEVFPAASSCRWDLVIVDEAHACAGTPIDAPRSTRSPRGRRTSCC